MPAQSTQVRGSAKEATKKAPATVEEAESNAQLAEALRSEEGTKAGLANYQATLGAWLGSSLYEAVAPHLTLEKLSGFANDGLEGALTGAVGLLEDLPGDVCEDHLDAFGTALADKYGGLAGDWLEGDGQGVATALADWVDAHPKTIVTVALLAAAAAILANADLPELSKKFSLGDGFSAEVGAKLGQIRSIALEQVKAQLSYTSGPLAAAMKATWADGEVTGEAQAKLGDKDQNIIGDITFTDDGFETFSLRGLYTHDRGIVRGGATKEEDKDPVIDASIETRDGDLIRTRGVSYDTADGVFRFNDAKKLLVDSGAFSMNTTKASDGTDSVEAGYEGALGSGGLSGKLLIGQYMEQTGKGSAYELTAVERAAFGLKLDKQNLDFELEGMFGTDGNGTLEGKADSKLGGDFVAGGNVKATFGDDSLYEVGAYYGYRSATEFRTYLGRYNYDSGKDAHTASLLLEDQVGDVMWRIQQQTVVSPSGLDLSLSGHAATYVDDDVALIGGVRYEKMGGKDNIIPEVGVQVKGIPLTLGYDTANKGVRLGITIPFGR